MPRDRDTASSAGSDGSWGRSSAAPSFALTAGAQPGRAHEGEECKKESEGVPCSSREPESFQEVAPSTWNSNPQNLSKGVAFTLLKDLEGSAPGGDSDALPASPPAPSNNSNWTQVGLQVLLVSEGRKICSGQEDPPGNLPEGWAPPLSSAEAALLCAESTETPPREELGSLPRSWAGESHSTCPGNSQPKC